MSIIHEPARDVPVIHSCDICVVGGSCTGVFAAVRAARLGATVALIENNGFFGGVATAGLVNIWHSTRDTTETQPIIGGLTSDILERLQQRGAAHIDHSHPRSYAAFNSAELALELDQMIREHPSITPFLHTRFVAPVLDDRRITHAIIEDKTGRRAIQAACFIDASGDGDLIARAGLPFTRNDDLQPPTTCAVFHGLHSLEEQNDGFDLGKAVHDSGHSETMPKGYIWGADVVGVPGARMVAGTRVHGADCSDAAQLTRAEMEGRRQVRAIRDIVRDTIDGGEAVAIGALPACIGIRETRHVTCLHRLTEMEVLEGVRFPDAIANGSYRVDIHHSDKPGITLRYLDGREDYSVPGEPTVSDRWREPRDTDPTFYQIPYRSLVPETSENVLVAGRLVDADRGAYGAVRVMVNCNQTGEAAGVACTLALDQGATMAQVDPSRLRTLLKKEGAVII